MTEIIVSKLPVELQEHIKGFLYGEFGYNSAEICTNCALSFTFVETPIYHIYDEGILYTADYFCSKFCLEDYVEEL